ncbi:MAG: ATP-binding protein [Myxococcota bacterium]|nr:ATP-binding protein [Myxococcota bacterium]
MSSEGQAPIRFTEEIEVLCQGEYAIARRHETQVPCPRCAGVGSRRTMSADGRYQIALPCRCQRLDRSIRLFSQAGIPARYYGASFESFVAKEISGEQSKRRAARFAWEFSPGARGLLFYGGYGTGKTYLAAAILHVLVLNRGLAARFIEFTQLLSTLKGHYQRRENSVAFLDELHRTPCLVIDELGEGAHSEWAESVLEELISRRYNASLTTIFTTNFDPRLSQETQGHQLRERVGARLYSRLQQMCDLLPLFGVDHRSQRGGVGLNSR